VSIDGDAAVCSTVALQAISCVTRVVDPATVIVSIDGVAQWDQPISATSDAWNLTLDGSLSDGDHAIIAAVTDAGGSAGSFTQTLTVATTPPIVMICGEAIAATNNRTLTGFVEFVSQILTVDLVDLVDSVVAIDSGTTNLTNTASTTFTARIDVSPGVSVAVSVDGASQREAVVQTDRTWNVTFAVLDRGSHEIVATVIEPSGNTGILIQKLTTDTALPYLDPLRPNIGFDPPCDC
jgi:hypothetical protein